MARVRHAIIALGTIIIMTWLSDMPSVVTHGLEFKSAFSAVETTSRIIAFPLVAAETGEVEIRWTDEKGEFRVERKTLTVT